MTAQTMMAIYCSLIIGILVLGFIGGIIHGRRKATFKLITTIIFYVVFFFMIDQLAVFLVDYPLLDKLAGFGIALPAELEGASTIKEACAQYLLSIGLSSEEIIPVLMSFAVVIAKIVITVIYFIPIGLIYCILVNIIYYAFFRRKGARVKAMYRKEERKQRLMNSTNHKKLKLNYNRFEGGFLGFIKKIPQVIVIIAVTTGIVNLIPSVYSSSTDGKANLTTNIESDELLDLLEKNNLTEYVKFIEMYRNSAFVKVLGGTDDNKRVSGFIFDRLTKGQYEDYVLDLPSEMAFILSTSVKAYDILGGKTNVNELSADQQKAMCELLKDINDSELIMSLLPIGASVALSLQQVKDSIASKAPGLELDTTILQNVNWEQDIINISDTAIALIDLSNGFQNLNNLNYFDLGVKEVKTLTQCIANVSLLMNIIPVLAEYVVSKPEVQAQIGDLTEEIKDIVWSDELEQTGLIYEKFVKLGLDSFENILGNLTATPVEGQEDKLDLSQELITTMFESQFVSMIFPLVFNKIMQSQSESVQQLFADVKISEWDNELNTIIDLARDIRDNGGQLTTLDLTIVRDVNVDTILRSELLTQGFTNMLVHYDDPNSQASMLGDYLYIPEEYKTVNDINDNKWYKKAEKIIDEKDPNKVTYKVEHRELANLLISFQKILPAEGEIDFTKVPEYILQIDDKYLADDGDINRPDSSYCSIFDSDILRASISKMVATQDAIKDNMIIPLSVTSKVDDIDCITKSELNNMVKAVKALGFTDFNNMTPTDDLLPSLCEPVSKGSKDTKIDVALKSEIIHSTLSKYIAEMEVKTPDLISIPSSVKEEVKVLANDQLFTNIKTDEIKNLVMGMNYLPIKISEATNITPQDIFTLLDLDTTTNKPKIESVLNSKILHSTLSGKIISIPELKVDESLVTLDGDSKLISKHELSSLFGSLKIVMGDAETFDNIQFSPNTLVSKNNEELNALFESVIVRSTTTDLITTSGLAIPDDIKDEYTTPTVNKTELVNLVTAFGPTGLNLTGTDFNTNLGEGNILSKDLPYDVILNSKIINHKVTTTILSVENEFFKFANDTTVSVFINNNIDYLKNEEIIALINFANGNNLGTVNFDVIEILKDPTEFKNSKILNAALAQAAKKYPVPGLFDDGCFEQVKDYKDAPMFICTDKLFNVVIPPVGE